MNLNLLNYMGNTPLVKLNNPYGNKCGNVYVKLEEFNPGGSIKSRVGLQMIIDAEADGRIKKGNTLIEPTGGNTGIGLAIAAALKGYNLVLVIPDTFSKEKISTLKSLGAKIILSDHRLGNNSHIITAKEILKQHTDFICLDQFSNLSNPKAHYYGTGEELITQMKNNIDYFIAGIGSGGTIMGIGKRLKDNIPNVKVIGVQPKGCDILNNKFIPHKIQAIAVGVLSSFFDTTLIDSMSDVSFDEAQETRDYLAKTQGIFAGISSGANIAVAFRLSKNLNCTKNIVTVAPDSGRSYIEYES
jgi:cysteine synthase A